MTIASTPKKRPRKATALLTLAEKVLDDGKAEAPVVIDLRGKTSIADHMIIASGRSQRQVLALADRLTAAFKEAGLGRVSVEGLPHGDWVLIDAGDLLIHLFRPDVRAYYNLEKMWGEAFGEVAEA